MTQTNHVWLKTDEEKIAALIADEAKNLAILTDLEKTVRQLIQKNKFRLAIENQLKENK